MPHDKHEGGSSVCLKRAFNLLFINLITCFFRPVLQRGTLRKKVDNRSIYDISLILFEHCQSVCSHV
jgi:hypothetical protein